MPRESVPEDSSTAQPGRWRRPGRASYDTVAGLAACPHRSPTATRCEVGLCVFFSVISAAPKSCLSTAVIQFLDPTRGVAPLPALDGTEAAGLPVGARSRKPG